MMDKSKIVSISNGNSKMGAIPSVSLPPVVTCTNCASCAKKCYAAKLCRIYPTVKAAYDKNLKILNTDSKSYFDQVKMAAAMTRFFRLHVSGDIISRDYFENMVKISRYCKGTKFLAFTKNYDVVNSYLDDGHRIPKNLKIVFSIPFDGAEIPNKYNLPTAAVIMSGCDPKPNYKICGGNCAECGACGIGCWELKKGETIAFYEH